MLWLKGWQETRVRVCIGLGLTALIFLQFHFAAVKTPPEVFPIAGFNALAAIWTAVLLAGSGIATQPVFNASKGLHGSTLFTLSLPVSRLRLLAVRAALGWLEVAGFICALSLTSWITFPGLKQTVAPQAILAYAGVLIVCTSGLYSISVLFATFLDDIWRVWFSLLVFAALFLLFRFTGLPLSVNIFRAMTDHSPLVTHTMPWTAMALSVASAAIFFLASLKIVRIREY